MSITAGTVSPGSPPSWWRDPGFYKSIAAIVSAIVADTIGNGSLSPVVQSVVTGLGGLIAATYLAGNAVVRARSVTVTATAPTTPPARLAKPELVAPPLP